MMEHTDSTERDLETKAPPAQKPPEKNEYPTMKNGVRQNTVGRVLLHGVHIVSLVIDNIERLCLAQISTTLLKQYSYNEIHNRRVALGITCVQCTPVQLEILRRAGAMPISSRRCGMITKREAERLVKSFLEDTSPPKLPEDFAFAVEHKCGWGCEGKFVPSRYNSSRAKCIKCCYCSMFFSPNKFIFHYHRTPESKYSHPDAANFNSWRRHLKLKMDADDDLQHVWEDVKAMFNGGSRKRVLSSFATKSHSNHQPSYPKKPKLPLSPTRPSSQPVLNSGQFPYPVYHSQNASYPIKSMSPHPTYITYPYNKPLSPAEVKGSVPSWPTAAEAPYSSYDYFWSKHLHATSEQEKHLFESQRSLEQQKESVSQLTPERLYTPLDCRTRNIYSGEKTLDARSQPYLSAFKPVGKPTTPPMSDAKSTTSELDNVSIAKSEASDCDDVDNENFEIDIMDDSPSEGVPVGSEEIPNDSDLQEPIITADDHDVKDNERSSSPCEPARSDSGSRLSLSDHMIVAHSPGTNQETEGDREVAGDEEAQQPVEVEVECECEEEITQVEEARDPDNTDDSNERYIEREFMHQSKDEIIKELCKEMDLRKKLEEECKLIKETFQQQLKRELTYRERQVAQQIQRVREKFYHELDQEKNARYSLQQKLKEAHDALHNFSCKMLASRQCAECSFKEQVLPR